MGRLDGKVVVVTGAARGQGAEEVRALAANASLATFSIGSRLLAVRDGLLNALLSAMLGSNINLSAMSYEALLDADSAWWTAATDALVKAEEILAERSAAL